jgi:hypothetical protein
MANQPISIRSYLHAAVVLLAVCSTGLAPVRASQFGDIETFASVPASPGFPEGVVVHGNRVFVLGPARFGTAGTGPSAIQVYNRKTGALVTTIEVSGEDLDFEHALSNGAVDCDSRVYMTSSLTRPALHT